MTGISIEELRDSLIRREQPRPDAAPLWTIPPDRAAEAARAADTVEECVRVLEKGGGNVVGELLRGQGEFTHWTHYPQGDVHDRETHAQYYYHAHPTAQRSGEHGHFHTFLRAAGMPKGSRPAALPDAVKRPLGKDALCHLVAISMNESGRPLRLFTVNRWVTGESWYAAEDAIAMLDRFEIRHAVPGLPANRWVGAMLRLFRPQIEWLLRERDAAVRTWAAGNPGADAPVWEDRRLETTSALDISVPAQARLARAAAARFGRAPTASSAPANGAFRRRHLLGIAGMSAAEIECLLDRAQFHAARGAAADRSALRGRTIVNLFFETSTRTRTSFELAGKRLGADVLNMQVETSAIKKGETLIDTAMTLNAMRPDALVVRHPDAGAAQLLSEKVECAVLNAGDGSHEHPTQALVDALTMRRRRGRIAGLLVAICGDIRHSRVARSNIHLLTALGARARLIAPPTLLPAAVERLGVEVFHDMKAGLEDCDVVMMLRLQTERMRGAWVPSAPEYFHFWGLDEAKLARARPDALVMHPGPINRGVEIDSETADNMARSTILEQVELGVAVRMACLELLLGAA